MTGIHWVTFDCFGTLIDWRHGIRTSAELLYPGRGADVLDRYHAHEADVERERPGRRYREVLAETLARATADLGLPLGVDDAAVLGATIPFWPTFDDVAPELGALRAAGWRLALLTNCDRDLIGHTQRRLGVDVDAIVTAELVGSYKPAHGHFTRFAATFEPGAWVHVAEGYTFDIQPAAELGITSVWINRQGDGHDAGLATATQPDLRGLLATVERVAGGA